MSVFHRLAPLMSEESASCRQTNEHSKVCLPPPLALSSPVVKKKAIHIPSFDEKGLIFEKHNTKLSTAEKSSDLTSSKTSIQPSWRTACQYSQRNHGERSSTFPRTKPKPHGSQSFSAKPNVYAPAAPKPNSPPTPPTFKSKPSDSLHLPASPWSDFSPLPHCPKPSVSPTLTVPTPRLTPSPTSVCQGTSSDGQSGRQLSPVARERCARSIPISNTKAEPLDEVRHDILDERALLDFTHPGFRRVRTLTSRESRHQTESDRLTITSQDSNFLQSKVGGSKNMYTAKDKPQTPHVDFAVMSKSKPNVKEHKKCQPSEAIKHAEIAHKGSQLAFDGQAAQSNPQRTCADYIQKSTYSQASDFTSSHQSHKQIYPGKRATSKMSFSSEPPLGIVSTNAESRRRRFDLHNETRGDPSGSHHQRAQEESIIQTSIIGNTSKFFKLAGESQSVRKSSQKYGFLSKTQSQTTQMDVKREVTQPDCVSKDYSSQSRGVDQEMGISQCAYGLNRLNTCLVAPQAQEAFHPVSAVCLASCGEFFLKPGLQSHNQSPGQHKSHREFDVSDTSSNKTDSLDRPDRHEVSAKLLEHPRPPSMARCPFNTNSFGSGSKGVFELPQQRVYQRPELTTATSPQLKYSDRAFITEESEAEDPYYVTMYYPGSVYVGEYRHPNQLDDSY